MVGEIRPSTTFYVGNESDPRGLEGVIIIPAASDLDLQWAVPRGDGRDPFGLRGEAVPCVAAGIDDRLAGLEDAVGEDDLRRPLTTLMRLEDRLLSADELLQPDAELECRAALERCEAWMTLELRVRSDGPWIQDGLGRWLQTQS